MYKEASVDLPSGRINTPQLPADGNLFPDDEIYPMDDDFPQVSASDFVQESVALPEKRILEQTFTSNAHKEVIVNQRKITKLIAFFDDGSYQEMQ